MFSSDIYDMALTNNIGLTGSLGKYLLTHEPSIFRYQVSFLIQIIGTLMMIDFGSYGSGEIISRGCVQFYPVAVFYIQDGRQKK